ncbi:MAG: alpha/beta hydrolase family protein [Acidimicrobiia bacterium]
MSGPETLAYGPEPDHVGDLRVPDGDAPHPVVVLLHGGFWREQWRRDLMDGLATMLTRAGFATWNLEYRRIGRGGGWPATLLDVADGVDHLSSIPGLDLKRVVVLGHSAGGHLALWAAGRQGLAAGLPGADPAVTPESVLALAPVADLEQADALALDDHAVSEFLRGPSEEKFRAASPIRLLPLSVRQVIVHGDDDRLVPVEMSRRYVKAARAAGDEVTYEELKGGDHMSLIDPGSEAVARWLELLGER